MFFVLAFSLLSAIRRDPFAVSSRLSGDFAGPEFTPPASGLSFEQKTPKPRESCQPSQNGDPSRIVILSDEPERRISLMVAHD
jgi:hypothetical protein